MSQSKPSETRPSEGALADTLPAEVPPQSFAPAERSSKTNKTKALAETIDAPGPQTPDPRASPPSSPELARLRIAEPQRYRIGSEFAQGGIGRILRARDERLDRQVAIKELLRGQGDAEDRFVREALITARLQHPSIVPVYDAGRRPTGELFYAMKLVSGRSFDEVIGETRTLEQRLALLPHVLAVAEAIAYAHSERIIHRDLKPSNILVGAFGETVVIDWGLGKDLTQPSDTLPPDALRAVGGGAESQEKHENVAGAPPFQRPPAIEFKYKDDSSIEPSAVVTPAITVEGSVMGTPAYMAPEQAGGQPVDERADVYALGAILYHLLAGASPYDGDDARVILRAVSAGPPPPLEARQQGIPEDLLAIVRKAMAREVDFRYRTAKELADDLRRFQTGQIVGAHAYSRMELVRRFARRYKTPLAVAAVALLVLAGVGAISVISILEQREAAERKEAEAVRRNDELTVLQARTSLESDPNKTIAWLKSLSPSFSRWSSVRVLAADAEARGLAKVLRGHSAAVNSLAFSPDGSLLATASHDKTLRLIPTGAGETRVFSGHTDEVWQVAFSSNKQSHLIASASKDTSIRLWDPKTGAARVLSGHTSGVREIAFSPDGSRLASCSWDDTARLWDTKTGEATVYAMKSKCVGGIVFSPDGARFATAGSDNAIRVWSASGGEAQSLNGHEDWPLSIAFSPAGNAIASGGRDATVRLWDPITRQSRALSGHEGAVFAVAFSPDGKIIASAGQEGIIRLWDAASGAALRALEGHRADVRRITFSPDGNTIASASDDRTARLWDLESGDGRLLYGFDDAVASVAFSPDGALVAASSLDGTARLYPAKSRSGRALPRAAREAQIMSTAFSPDGGSLVIASMDGTALAVDLAGGDPLLLRGHEGAVTDAVFSPSGDLIASAGRDGTARVWDRSGHEVWSFRAHEGGVAAMVFLPPSSDKNARRYLATAGRDGSLRLSDVDSGESRIVAGPEAAIARLEPSPDGRRLATGSRDGSVRIVSIETGEIATYRDHEDAIRALAFSPDSAVLASGSTAHTLRFRDLARGEVRPADITGGIIGELAFSADGRAIYLFAWPESVVRRIDVQTGKEIGVLRGHVAGVTGFSMSPDGSRLASTSYDKTLRLWNLDTGESRSLRGHADAVLGVTFSPRGDALASMSADGSVRLWWDDLPFAEGPLRSWLGAAAADAISIEDPR
jgi:WD40 repeat protein/serine/threonine protein kinase